MRRNAAHFEFADYHTDKNFVENFHDRRLPDAGTIMTETIVAKLDINPLSTIDGFLGAALVDLDSGMALAKVGGGSIDMDVAAAGNAAVVKAKRRAAAALDLKDSIEDILITLGRQMHLVRPLERNDNLFLYLALDRGKANLAMARHELKSFEKSLEFA